MVLFQIRDKEKSNGQLREELGGVLEKNKNIMEEAGTHIHHVLFVLISLLNAFVRSSSSLLLL